MLRKLFLFEVSYHTKKLLFLLAAAAFLFFGFVFSSNNLRIPNVYSNSPYVITHIISLLSLGIIFITTILSGNSLLRDAENNMDEIIHTTPISKFNFLFSRFSGVFTVSSIAFCFTCLGVLLGTFSHMHNPERLTDTNLFYYVWLFIVIVLPNVFFCSSVMFLTAVIAKNRIAVYVGGLFIYILYVTASIFSNSPWLAGASPADPQAMSWAALIDPFGISAFFEQTRYWSVLEKNTKLISLSGNFLFNRIIWISIAITLLAIAYKLFLPGAKNTSKKYKSDWSENENVPKNNFHTTTYSLDNISQWQAVKSLTGIELTSIIKSLPFLIINLCWIFLYTSETLFSINSGLRLSSVYPETGIIISNIMTLLPFFGIIVIIFYSGEQIWRNRSQKFDELIDSTPVNNKALFLSKYFTLVLIPLILITESIIIGIIIQLCKGYTNLEPQVYLSVFYFSGLPLILTAVLALFIQNIIPNKYIGIAITGLLLLITNSPLSFLFGINHIMLRFAMELKNIEYSAMNGFGQYTESFMWRMIYWSAASVILALLTYGLWQRGKEYNLKHRLKLLLVNLGRNGKIAALVAVIVFIGSGYYIFYNTNIINEYETKEDRRDWSQAYEKKYKQFQDLPAPVISDIKANIDLYPEEQMYKVKGHYLLKNKSNKEIKKFLLGIDKVSSLKNVKINSAKMIEADGEFNCDWYEFDQPLKPGEEIEMDFEFQSGWSPFSGHASFNSIVSNGSFVRISRYFPFFGYNSEYELTNPELRKERGLPELEGIKKLPGDSSFSNTNYNYNFINFEATVSTSLDQTAVVPGSLLKTWTKDNRNYFQYKTTEPIPNRFAVSSAKYKKEKINHKGINIEIYYHPAHYYNIKKIIEAAKNTFDYCTKNFGPYKYKVLKIAEVSKFTSGFAATAYPNTLYGIEHLVFISDLRDSTQIDWLYQSVAHEISHQWWGGQVHPEEIEGGIVLTETMAQYTEYMIYEKYFGKEAANKSLNVELDLYLSQRGFGKEVPLYIADGKHPHIPYNKGAKVMYAIKELIGEESVNEALRNLIEKYSYPKQPPTSYDLLKELYKVSPPKYHSLINDWMKKIIIYDLQIKNVKYTELRKGSYKVDVKIITNKLEDDGNGNENKLNINEEFDVMIWTGDKKGFYNSGNILYSEKHRFTEGETDLSIIVDKLPEYIGIDPYIYMIDKDRADNVKEIK